MNDAFHLVAFIAVLIALCTLELTGHPDAMVIGALLGILGAQAGGKIPSLIGAKQNDAPKE